MGVDLNATMAGFVDSHRRFDALLWLFGCGIILSVLPIGFVTGDGLALSSTYARGTWSVDPNHLFYEPLGAWWQTAMTRIGAPRAAPDQLKWLSILAGAITVALFRWGLAPLAARRAFANLATAWVAGSSAFARLWISDKAETVQMPWLVLLAVALLAFVTSPGWRTAVVVGVWGGVATLFFVSNVLIVVFVTAALAIWYGLRRAYAPAVRLLAGTAGGVLATAGGTFVATWLLTRRGQGGFLTWMTSYTGNAASTRVSGVYGLHAWRALVPAAARAVYGAASALVDLEPAVGRMRDGLPLTLAAVVGVLAAVAAAAVVLAGLWGLVREADDQAKTGFVLVLLGWIAGVLVFGFYWNASDDQFYFQLAIPVGLILAARRWRTAAGRTLFVSLSVFVLAWNVADLGTRLVLYPRAARLHELEAVVGTAGLLVYPGEDEVDQLAFFLDQPPRAERISIAALADRYPPDRGLAILTDRIRETLARGARVDIVAVFDVPPRRQPWKDLQGLGYDRATLLRTLEQFPVSSTSTMAGPFPVRSVLPGDAPSEQP